MELAQHYSVYFWFNQYSKTLVFALIFYGVHSVTTWFNHFPVGCVIDFVVYDHNYYLQVIICLVERVIHSLNTQSPLSGFTHLKAESSC